MKTNFQKGDTVKFTEEGRCFCAILINPKQYKRLFNFVTTYSKALLTEKTYKKEETLNVCFRPKFRNEDKNLYTNYLIYQLS